MNSRSISGNNEFRVKFLHTIETISTKLVGNNKYVIKGSLLKQLKMKFIKLRVAVVFMIIYFSCVTESELTISGVQCGSKKCEFGEYCSEYDRLCRPCTEICNERHHNYQASTCMTSCQGKWIFLNSDIKKKMMPLYVPNLKC